MVCIGCIRYLYRFPWKALIVSRTRVQYSVHYNQSNYHYNHENDYIFRDGFYSLAEILYVFFKH